MLRTSEQDSGYVEILLDQVPKYLRVGDYFKALSENDEGSITVPANVLKPNLSIETSRDLKHLLESLQFWIVTDSKECVEAVATYLLDCDQDDEILTISELVEEFKMTFPYLLIMHAAIKNAEHLKTNARSALILYVLERHPCSFDILLHISKHHHFQTCVNGKTMTKIEQEHHVRARDFLGQYRIHSLIEEGNVDLLKYLYENDICSADLCDAAVKSGSVECFHFLRSKGECVPPYASSVAAGRGHVSILKYFNDNGLRLDYNCSTHAADGGHLQCLRYLHSIGQLWRPNVSFYAAHNGHLECLRFVHENGCPWDENTCCTAALRGHLACLKYAHENDCAWHTASCLFAVVGGHLACLQYAVEHGCPYESDLALTALSRGHDVIGFYILEHCANLSNTICTFAAEKGRLDILQACVRAGIPWPSDIVATATRPGHLRCVEFALAHGAPRAL